jgi:hypothetical protein
MGWLAMLSCAPLIFSLAHPPLPVLILLWVLAGAGGAYQLVAAAAFVTALPAARRVRAFAVAQSGLLASQGLGILTGGAVAQRVGPTRTVALAGLLGLLAAAALASGWTRRHAELVRMLMSGREIAVAKAPAAGPPVLNPPVAGRGPALPAPPQTAETAEPAESPPRPTPVPERPPGQDLRRGSARKAPRDRPVRGRLTATRFVDQVLGDRRALPFLWDDDPRGEVHQHEDTEGHHRQGNEDQPDHGGVDTGVLAEPGADAGHEPTFPCPD